MGRKAESTAEDQRLAEDARRERNWKRWGPYLAERQWGTVREDYSHDGECWRHFPHEHARSRVYRWGEDGLLGICDRQARLCFALGLWNERDPILKERLFGLSGPEGNHGEDVKELYYYLDATPTYSYAKSLYKYPHGEFPYEQLVRESRARDRFSPEFELADTGIFEAGYFDVLVEYAKGDPDDILIRVTIQNHGRARAPLHVLSTLWFRNTWSWGRTGEGYGERPRLSATPEGEILAEHAALGRMLLDPGALSGARPELWFTDNETNSERLWGVPNVSAHVKDAFHARLIDGDQQAVNPARRGTKAAAHYSLLLEPGASATLRLRLCAQARGDFDALFAARIAEADAFYRARRLPGATPQQQAIARQAYAGLLHTKQFYHYVVEHWLEGDPTQPPPPPERRRGRNADWKHLYNRDLISMPDKWEYPWYAAWDLAFHMLPMANVDPDFAKQQLVLLLREWYMHPNGQLPAYEFQFGDVNPPVHAWAALGVYEIEAARGRRDRVFLARVFKKLLLNFTWWVNRKDAEGDHLFSGGFLGLDNIGLFDRSQGLPGGGRLEQADGTAWMAFYAVSMLRISLELAREDASYEDMASKFFEHFIAIVDAMNTLGGSGLWNERDGFYYDQLHIHGRVVPLETRSLVGLVPLFAVLELDAALLDRLPGFARRTQWVLDNRPDLARHISCLSRSRGDDARLLAMLSRERLERVLRRVFDEREFLSPFGVRSLSRHHEQNPVSFSVDGREYRVDYTPGESTSGLFGGNSNWRGPIWFPLNWLLIEALERYHAFYRDELRVELPTGSGNWVTLDVAAREIARRLVSLFDPSESGRRPCHGADRRYADDPAFRELVLFYEYFHADTGAGLGASHQTGWTALVAQCLERLASVTPRPAGV